MYLTQLVGISVPLTAIFALAVVVALYLWLRKQDAGTERMQEIARFIQIGANTFLRREFLAIAPFVAILALLLFVTMPEGNWQIALGFVGAGAQLRYPRRQQPRSDQSLPVGAKRRLAALTGCTGTRQIYECTYLQTL